MRSSAMFDLTAYLKYKTRALICGGKKYDEISDNASLIKANINRVTYHLSSLRWDILDS